METRATKTEANYRPGSAYFEVRKLSDLKHVVSESKNALPLVLPKLGAGLVASVYSFMGVSS